MKKLMLAAAVLAGGVAISQAQVRVSIGLPLPPLPGIVIRHPPPYYPPQVVVAPPVCAPAPCETRVVVAPPVYAPAPCGERVVVAPPVCAPRVVVRDYGYGYRDHWRDRGRSHGYSRRYDRHRY